MSTCPSCGAPVTANAAFCMECGEAFSGSEARPTDPWLGRMVAGRFRIASKLGDGGMGEVYRAEQLPMGRFVALKILRQNLSEDPQQVERFKREAQAASQLSSPNTIIVHDFGQDADGTLFIAMEFLEGSPLSAVLEKEKSLPPVRAARIMAQICASLSEAHERGLIHRDLKPENIFLINRNGVSDFIKVLDFGIAKVTHSSSGGKLETITRAGAMFGTPQYMSPEQIRGEELDARSDIYALGVMLYQLIAGHLPFEAGTLVEMLTKHLTASPMPIVDPKGPQSPQSASLALLEGIALRALSKNPAQRQPSARVFMEELMAAVPDMSFSSLTGLMPATPAGTPSFSIPNVVMPSAPAAPIISLVPVIHEEPESKSRAGLVILLTALLAAGGAGLFFYLKGPAGQDPSPAPVVLAGGGEDSQLAKVVDATPAPVDAVPVKDVEVTKVPDAAVVDAAKPADAAPAPDAAAVLPPDAAVVAQAEPAGEEVVEEPAEVQPTTPMTDEEAKAVAAKAAEEASAAEKESAEAEKARLAKAAEEKEKGLLAAQADKQTAASEKTAAQKAAAEVKATAEGEKAARDAAAAAAAKAKADQAAQTAKADIARYEAEKAAAESRAQAAKADADRQAALRDKAAADAKERKARADADKAEKDRKAAEARLAQVEAEKAAADRKIAEAVAGRAAAEKAAAEARAEADRLNAELNRIAEEKAAEEARIEEAKRKAEEARARRAAALAKKRSVPTSGMVSVTTRSRGAKIFVDGKRRGTTPLAHPLRLKPGRHTLEVRKGSESKKKTIQVKAGQRLRISLAL